jgi:hypothetical protein
MGARDRLKNANQHAMNAVDQTLESLNREPLYKEEPIKEPVTKPEIKETEIEAISNNINVAIDIKSKEKQQTKKTGRPAKWLDGQARLSFIVSPDMKEKIETASIFFGGSITDYITTLINNDIDKNYEMYKKQEELLKSFKRR